jgi:hypothetical protein
MVLSTGFPPQWVWGFLVLYLATVFHPHLRLLVVEMVVVLFPVVAIVLWYYLGVV